MPMLLGLAQILLIGLVLFFAWLVLYVFYALSHPARKSYAWALARSVPGDPSECTHPREFETIEMRGHAGTLHAWRIIGDNPSGAIVVMVHGWGSSKQGGLKRLDAMTKHAREVILWDLPGHGDSDGGCRLGTSEHNDLLAVLDTIELGAPIVLYGSSMGAGICLKACIELDDPERISAVICEAPYVHAKTPARNVIRLRGFPERFNLPVAIAMLGVRFGIGPKWNGFARDALAASLGSTPLLVIHGEEDPVCPISDGERIANAALNASLVRIKHGGHNNLWTDEHLRSEMIEATDAFLAPLISKNAGSNA